MITITEATIAKLDVQKGDVLVLTCPNRLSGEQMQWLGDACKGVFRDTPLIILQDGMRLSVVSKEEADTRGEGE